MNLVFAGTPRFAVPTLEKLVEAGFHVRLVVTQPDRPRGRGMELTASPVKESARKLDIPVPQPEKIKKNPEFRGELSELRPDAIIVVGYGRIIPQWMIDLPVLGNLNVHASSAAEVSRRRAHSVGDCARRNGHRRHDHAHRCRPRYRRYPAAGGAAHRGRRHGGNYGAQTGSLGADLMVETLRGLREGSIISRHQNHEQATLAPILKKEDGQIDFHRSATEIWNRLRGFQPWPGAFTSFRGKNLHVWSARPVEAKVPMGAIQMAGELPMVGCSPGTALEVTEVQVEGKKRMSAQDFVNGYRPFDGELLGAIPSDK